MSIEFIATPFVASHGKQPKGRGVWAFSIERNPVIDDVWFSPSVTFSDAKKLARQHFAGKTDIIFVQP